MRLAVISDIHLGDPSSSMARIEQPEDEKLAGRGHRRGQVVPHEKDRKWRDRIAPGYGYELFRDAVRDRFDGQSLDYLVLLGDVLDFSIQHYSRAYSIAGKLFGKMIDDDLLQQRDRGDEKRFGPVIYVPGNHDLDMWNTVEYQVNISQRLNLGKEARRFRMSVPAIIHDQADGSEPDVFLHGVSNRRPQKYGGLFLDHLTEPPISFYFGFPNLYFVSEGETILMTHGQYFNFFWSFLGQWAVKIFGDALKLRSEDSISLAEMVGLNYPTGQLSCSAIGQAGKLTKIIRTLEHDIKAHDRKNVKRYLNRLLDELLKRMDAGLFKIPGAKRIARCVSRKIVTGLLDKSKPARDYEQYLRDPDIKANFEQFYQASIVEIEKLQAHYPFDIPYPSRMIFGHTHQPVSWEAPEAVEIPQSGDSVAGEIRACNTGGWLYHANDHGPGAEVFFYETGKGFSSKRIRYESSVEV